MDRYEVVKENKRLREEAIKENNRRYEAERELFDGLCVDPINIPLKKIKIYNGDPKNECQNDELVAGKTYLVVRDGKPFLGVANKQWFGWQFAGNGYWQQLNHVDMVFEIDFPEFPSKPLGRVEVPTELLEDCDDCDAANCDGCPFRSLED